MPKLIAVEEFPYPDSVARKPGDVFDATDEHAELLKGSGKARDADPSQSQSKVMSTTGDGSELFNVNDPQKTKRRYRRSDMRAED